MSEVFLSYASSDRKDVSALAATLHALGVGVWFDEWMLVPGTAWQPALAQAVAESRCAASFVGPSGRGPWQQAETMLAVDRAMTDRTYRLIPVLLPDAPPTERINIPDFLNLFTWIEFRKGLNDPNALRRLLAGIKGHPPGPTGHEPSQIVPDTGYVDANRKRRSNELVDAIALAEALRTIGLPQPANLELAKWLQQECVQSLERNEISRQLSDFYRRLSTLELRSTIGEPANQFLLSDFYDRLSPLKLRSIVGEAAHQFLDEWLSSLFPSRLLARAFYLSVDKTARAFRSYKPALSAHFGSRSFDCDTAEDKFSVLHRFFFETGTLVFLPARLLAGQDLVWSFDPVIYFVGVFTLTRNEEFDVAFPHVGRLITDGKATVGLVNDVFNHPDPFLNPYVSLTGYVGHWRASASLSRRHVSVNSSTVDRLLGLLEGAPTVIAGFGSIEKLETNELRVQPLACHFSSGQRWLHPIGTE